MKGEVKLKRTRVGGKIKLEIPLKTKCQICKKMLETKKNFALQNGSKYINRYNKICYICYAKHRPTSSVKKPEAVYVKGIVEPKARLCLLCGKSFDSWGPGNRRCGRCSTKIKNNESDFHMPRVAMKVGAGP